MWWRRYESPVTGYAAGSSGSLSCLPACAAHKSSATPLAFAASVSFAFASSSSRLSVTLTRRVKDAVSVSLSKTQNTQQETIRNSREKELKNTTEPLKKVPGTVRAADKSYQRKTYFSFVIDALTFSAAAIALMPVESGL